MRLWSWLIPVLALGLLLVALAVGVGTLLAVLCGAALVGAVLVAVHHAEVVAHRVGEPFGTLILALAVTAIEAALILSMMIAGGEEMAVLPRDAIYAAVMIICTGVIGLCDLLGGLAHHEQSFRVEGAGAGLAALIVMATLTLVLPVFTTSTPDGTYSNSQLRVRGADFGDALGDFHLCSDRASSGLLHSTRPTRPTSRHTPSRRRPARLGRASGCFSSRSSRLWDWPRSYHPQSSMRSTRPMRPGRWWEL